MDLETQRWTPTSHRSNCRSQQSVDGQQGGVEQNSSQDEKGGPQSSTGKDLTHTKKDATHHLDKREKLEEDFTLCHILQIIIFKVNVNVKAQEQKHTQMTKTRMTKCVDLFPVKISHSFLRTHTHTK